MSTFIIITITVIILILLVYRQGIESRKCDHFWYWSYDEDTGERIMVCPRCWKIEKPFS